MKKIFYLKSWQIFGMLIFLPIILIIMGVILKKITNLNYLINVFSFLGALSIIITYFGWIWLLGNYLLKLTITEKTLQIRLFNLLFSFALFVFLIVLPGLRYLNIENPNWLPKVARIVSFISFLYCIYIISKALYLIEKQKDLGTSNLIINFLLIWILPIGIWFLQPKLNKLEIKMN